MNEISPRLTRRDFLKILFTVGGGLATAELLHTLRSRNTQIQHVDRIKNIIFFIQENHSFDNLFAGFPGADSKFAPHTCLDALQMDPPHVHAAALLPNSATTEEANCSY